MASTSSKQSLPHVLSSLRSNIFGTAHNPTAARTGSKYLKRRLKGPSAVAYYPRPLNLTTLNAETPWNRFANWRGDSPSTFKTRVLGMSRVTPAQAGDNEDGTWMVRQGAAGSDGANATEGDEAVMEKRVWAAELNQLDGADALSGPPGKWREVERIPGAGWVMDAKERVRQEEVETRRAMGRGPPAKGMSSASAPEWQTEEHPIVHSGRLTQDCQGKRSQMKKK